MKLQFNLPNFDGFYHSHLDLSDYFDGCIGNDLFTEEDFDSIDWNATESKIASNYLDKWKEKNEEVLLQFGISDITYHSLDRPREYNFRTDDCVCIVKFKQKQFKTLAKEYINANKETFIQFLEDNYKSYSGFVSFYSHDFDTWYNDYLENGFNNVIFEGILNFITEPLTDDEKLYDILDCPFELIEYK